MDRLKGRLKADAERIEANFSPEFDARLDAAMHSASQIHSVPDDGAEKPVRWTWASVLTGLATAALVVVLMNWRHEEAVPDAIDPPVARTVPDFSEQTGLNFPMEMQTAVMTDPLEEELESLKEDLEKARESVERDLKAAF